jgi:tetratricopeptide (TPR) repeat protein
LHKVIQIRRRSQGANHPKLASSLLGYASHALLAGQFEVALEAGQEAITIREAGSDRTATESAYFHQSQILRALKRWPELSQLYRRKLVFLRQSYGPKHLKVAWRQLSLAESELEQGLLETAQEASREAVQILRETGPEHALETALELRLKILRRLGLKQHLPELEAEQKRLAQNRNPLG